MTSSSRMAEFIRKKNWQETPLGAMATWPSQLKTSVQIILDSRYPMFVWWGKYLINIYNDAHIPVLGNRHPQALGACASEVWSDVWDVVGSQVDIVFQEGRSTWNEDLPLFMRRHGFLEETFFTFSYSPIKDEQGDILGLFCACTEETSRVLRGRRLHTLRRMSAVPEKADSVDEVCRLTTEVLTDNPFDVPFSLIYLWDREERSLCLVAQSGFQPDSLLTPLRLELEGDTFHPQPWWPLSLSPKWEETAFTIDMPLNLPGAPWPEPPIQGMVLPVESWETQRQSGYLIVGISSRLALDDRYREFLSLLAKGISGAIIRAQVRTEERKRIEALAELNRVKTEFFSNVSHEFRTPLTLILGSLDEAMKPNASVPSTALAMAHRNTHRMLKLVNTLLDFSSLEAGRMQAVFEPVDLGGVTNDLAFSFESVMKNAGLEFMVTCPPMSRPVFVDRKAWEKIILNLLSNAFKFTLHGRVSVEVCPQVESVDVRIEDSGVGMSRETLAQVFDRFFRAKEALGRTIEGTGIGLALVKELVEMHGGKIHVESEPGKGSVFIVTVPFGFHHLPPEQVCHTPSEQTDKSLVGSFLMETEQWAGGLDHEPAGHGNLQEGGSRQEADHSRPTILLVEDNRDMRNYLLRLLRVEYEMVAVCDGQEALERVHTIRPDLILSDIMMPRMDGNELLARLRSNQELQSIPFIFLSARAGQEAEINGLLTGADDYLVKPFSVRELLARVKKTLGLATMRRAAIEYESRFQHLAHHPEIMTWITDADGDCVFLSQTWYDFSGQTEATGLGEGWLSAIHPHDRPSIQQAFCEANRKRHPFRLEYRLRNRHGEYHYVLDSASPRFASDGRYLGYVGLVLDLSFQKDIEEQHRESEERFRTLANTISQFAWMADSTGWIFWYNARWYEYTGTTFKDMEGWGWRKVHHPDYVDRVLEKIRRCFQAGQIWEDTFPLKGKDGGYRWFLSRAVPIRNQNGEVVRWIGTNTDITELKTTQEQLQQLTTKLESRIAKRTAELRHNHSRLQALVGELILTEQRERRRIAEELHDFLAQLLVACRLRVNRLEQTVSAEGSMLEVLQDIDRILDQALGYTRSLVAQLVPSVLYQFGLLKALQWLAEDMKQYGLTVEVNMERDHLTLTENEAVLLFQSVRELMMNVVKHAGVDRVYLGVTLFSPDAVCIEISDQGVGFDPHLIEKHSHSSTQFGLFSIRERMGLIGGRMVIDSSSGSGTRIRLYVPLPDQEPPKGALSSPTVAPVVAKGTSQALRPLLSSGVRVLLVDDHAVVRQGLRSLLDAIPDVEVVGEAGDGVEAILLTESLQPDVVVMDINMPNMNGIEATRQIRRSHSGVHVIGLSVRQDKETEQAMREAGAAGFLSKESAAQELYRMIAEIVRVHQKFS